MYISWFVFLLLIQEEIKCILVWISLYASWLCCHSKEPLRVISIRPWDEFWYAPVNLLPWYRFTVNPYLWTAPSRLALNGTKGRARPRFSRSSPLCWELCEPSQQPISDLAKATAMAIRQAFVLPLVLVLLPALISVARAFSADSPTDRRLLVLVDDLAVRSSHSIYFRSLESRGYKLQFRLADDPKLALQRYGQYLYDGLVLFSPSAKSESYIRCLPFFPSCVMLGNCGGALPTWSRLSLWIFLHERFFSINLWFGGSTVDLCFFPRTNIFLTLDLVQFTFTS